MAMNRLRFEQDLPHGFSNKAARGTLPEPLPIPLNLNLGCGKDVRNDFINIDLFSDDPRVVAMDIRNLLLPDESADFILASDVLEHFSHREIESVLTEWARVLRPGGKIEIRCPNLKLQVNAYIRGDWNADVASYMIFGGQTNPGDYHCVAFDDESITRHLEKAGFTDIAIQHFDFPQKDGFINLNMEVTAVKPSKQESRSDEYDWLDFPDFGNQPDEPQLEDSAFDLDDLRELVGEDTAEHNENIAPLSQAKPQLNIVWEGSQFVWHSLALVNREHCLNLASTDAVNLTIIPYEDDTFSPKDNDKYKPLLQNDIRFKADVTDEIGKLPYAWIRHQWPPKAEPPNGAKWFIMQPWEFSVLRQDFAEIFSHANEIWTPSNFSRKAFIESGIAPEKVQVIPNGIAPEIFTPVGDKFPLKTQKQFKLLYVGGTIYRKGIDLLLRAYVENFTNEDDICLVIKDMGGKSFYKGQTAFEHIKDIQAKSTTPEIIYIDEDLSEQEMASLYRTCNVLVSPYRGEGFSLPALEAMACGIPVIVTDGGATDDFAQGAFSLKIKSQPKSIGDKLDGKPFVKEAFLLEPDYEHLKSILNDIFANPGNLLSMGAMASFVARTNWTWKKATLKLLTRLDYLYNTSIARDSREILQDIEDEALLLGIAENSYIAEDFDNASAAYIQLISAKDNVPHEHYLLALCRMLIISINTDDYDTADKFLLELERIAPNHPDTNYVKCIYYASKKMPVEALECITITMDNWNTHKFSAHMGYKLDDILVLTADLLLELNDLQSAHNLYTVALSLNNENSYACFGAAMCFESIDAKEEALTMYEWALRLNPEFESARIKVEELSGGES